ncbi:hypothetical protein OIU78_021580 [Salix suchowensis]|nr:hypothetical protein OIU78_021580 [Salix suchowensis]
MWSSPGANIESNNTTINSKVSGNSPSKSSTSTCSSPSSFSPSPPIPNQSMSGASMEEVWDDINLASLHDQSRTKTSSNTNHHSFNGLTKTAVSLGGDRRHKRMIKNRESAARSRARKLTQSSWNMKLLI